MRSRTTCENYIQSFTEEMLMIKSNVNMVRRFSSKRQKRSWPNLLGVAAKVFRLGMKAIFFSGSAYAAEKAIEKLDENSENDETVRGIIHNQKLILQHQNNSANGQSMIAMKIQEYNDLKTQLICSKQSIMI